MTFQQLASVDLNALNKTQLKAYTKLARQEWGNPIDLRTANIHDLIEYLQMYLHFKAETEAISCTESEAIAPQEAEVTEVEPTPTLSDFEGIEAEVMAVTDWFSATPISCDVCSYQFCELPKTIAPTTEASQVYVMANGYYYDTSSQTVSKIPNPDWLITRQDADRYLEMNARSKSDFFTIAEPAFPLVYDHETPSFNDHFKDAANALLKYGTIHGNEITTEWLSGILRDIIFIHAPNRVREKMLVSPQIFYSLAGLDLEEVRSMHNLLKNADAINIDVPEPNELSKRLIEIYGIDFTNLIAVCHQIRENFQHLQQLCGISSLSISYHAIRDKLFSAHKYDHQLIAIDSDRVILKNDAIRTANYFKELISDYNLFEENIDNEDTTPAPDDIDILALAHDADYVKIDSRSMRWAMQFNGSFRGVGEAYPINPDCIELIFFQWDEAAYDYEPSCKLVAVNRDNARFPWLTE